MNHNEQKQEDRIEKLENGQEATLTILKEIQETLKPIVKTYETASTLGKWFMAVLIFLSVVIGIAIGIKNLIK